MYQKVLKSVILLGSLCLLSSCSLFFHKTYTWDWRRDHPEYHALAEKMITEEAPEILEIIPADISQYSKLYREGDAETRLEFWALMLSAISWMESSHRTEHAYEEVGIIDSTGENVISRGLLQFSYESARGYNPGIKQPEDLHNPATSLKTGAVALRKFICRDQVISAGRKGEWRGLARYWSVLRNNPKHPQIKSWLMNADWENPKGNLIPPPPHLSEEDYTPWMRRFFSNPVKAVSQEMSPND